MKTRDRTDRPVGRRGGRPGRSPEPGHHQRPHSGWHRARSSSAVRSSFATARSHQLPRATRQRCAGARVIDARGMTVMPGFIDAHRHPIPGDTAAWIEKGAADEMRGISRGRLHDSGLAAITSVDGLELRRRIDAGTLRRPPASSPARSFRWPLRRPAGDVAVAGGAATRRVSTTHARHCVRRGRPARFPPQPRCARWRLRPRPASTTSRPSSPLRRRAGDRDAAAHRQRGQEAQHPDHHARRVASSTRWPRWTRRPRCWCTRRISDAWRRTPPLFRRLPRRAFR